MVVIDENALSADPESDSNESNDIAESTENSEDEENSSEEEGSDEDSDDVSDRSSSGSSEATEYDSSNVWSDEENDEAVQTREAEEAAILTDFQRSLNLILDGKHDKAQKILKRVLKNPAVSKHTTTEFMWENNERDNNHLNKMGRVFVAAHKNLAEMDEAKAIEHYLQVVAAAPCNDHIWFELGQRLVQKGDLDMAIYAFQRTSDWRAEEALMSAHFLRRNYKTALQMVASREERAGAFLKGDFLKKRIASMSSELHEFACELFKQKQFEVDGAYEKMASDRLSVVQANLAEKMEVSSGEKEAKESLAPINISLSADQSAWDVMTVFCDLFDRIQAFSQVLSQRIFIEEWECREDKLVVESTVEAMADDVVTVESTVQRLITAAATDTSGGSGEKRVQPSTANLGTRPRTKRTRRGQKEGEGATREEESSCDEEERPSSVDSVALREPSSMEDVETYYLDARPVRPLREGPSQAPSRMTATPGVMGSEEELLVLMREALYEERFLTLFKALETCVYSAFALDCLPSRSSHQAEVLIQCYRRWILCSPHLVEPHHLSIHAYFTLYDEPDAMDYCMRALHSSWEQSRGERILKFAERRDLLRFVYKRAERMSGEESQKWMRFLLENIQEDEAFNVLGGFLSLDVIREMVEKKERAGRIISLKYLARVKKWKEIVSIVESDCEWSSVDDEKELSVRTRIYSRALIKEGKAEKATEIINRMLSYLLSQPSLPATTITRWITLLNSIKYSAVPEKSKVLPSLGYSLLRLTEHSHLARDWKLWRVLHQVIKRIEESRPDLLAQHLNESLTNDDYNKSDDYEELPLRSLRFLVHAHDRMAMNGVCGQHKGAFLKYSLAEFRRVMEDERVREVLRYRKMQWLMSNVQAEIYQLLHCTFGRYSRKKKSAEDHGTGLEEGEESRRTMEDAIALSIPNPIPEFDDKNSGGSDLIDLVINRFPSFVKLAERRKMRVEELKRWVERGPVWKGDLIEGETREERMRSELLHWPSGGIDSKLESKVFYLFAAHFHRQSKMEAAREYVEYFLSGRHARSLGNEIIKSAWIIYSYATIERMFKLYDDDLLIEMNAHFRPMRVAMQISKKSDATAPFLLASFIYQTATRLSRFFRKLSPSDSRLVHNSSVVSDLRRETASLFESVLENAPAMQEAHQSAWDYQWLAYFYLAKLHLKGDEPDVAKAVEGFYEAACSLQLGGVLYPLKIPIKNQKNLEPVEVHYQAHSAVWKYITRCDNPSYSTLVRLRSYTDALARHGVVKPSAAMKLYEIAPVISETVLDLSFRVGREDEEKDEDEVMTRALEKVELIEELTKACKEAFKVIVDRFPHRKAYHRLAEIARREGDLHAAHSLIFKKIFPRRKKEDDLFEGVVEFTSTDIDRSDSQSFHTTRSLRLGIALSVRLGEAAAPLALCSALANAILNYDESHVLKCSYLWMVQLGSRALSLVLSAHPSQWTKAIKTELLLLHKILAQAKESLPLSFMREEVNKLIRKHGGVARMEMEVATAERKPQQRKRKVEDASSSSSMPTSERAILDRLGMSGRPPPSKMKPSKMVARPSTQPPPPPSGPRPPPPRAPTRPPTIPSTHSSLASIFTHALQKPSSPIRPVLSSTSLASSSSSPLSDPNRVLQMLIQQAAAHQNNPAATANLISKFLQKK